MHLKEELLKRLDCGDAWRLMYSEWEDGTNVLCPKKEDHSDGYDASLSLSTNGKAFCHACGFRATSPVGVYEALMGISFDEACKQLWIKLIEPLVPETFVTAAHASLLKHHLALLRLSEARGITLETVKKYKLGWSIDRLIIPIANEQGLVVNARRYDLFKRDPNGIKILSYKKGFGAARLWPYNQLFHKRIFILEGEMDTLLAIQLGVPAITETGGAQTWCDGWSKLFSGKDVILVPDIDPPDKRGHRAGIEGAKERAKSLSKFAASVSTILLPVAGTKTDKDFTDWIMKHGGTGKRLMELPPASIEAIKVSAHVTPGLVQPGAFEFDELSDLEEKYVVRGEKVFSYMRADGAFFRNQDGDLFYAQTGHRAFPIGSRCDAFMAYLTRLHPLINDATSGGKFIIRHVINRARLDSTNSKSGEWGLYLAGEGAIYLHSGDGNLLKAKDGELSIIKNAVNDEKLLLEAPESHKAFKPVLAAKKSDAVNWLWDNVGKNLPMTESNKYQLLCWALSIFFRNEIRDKPLVRLLAKTASGKSTTSKLLSSLVYGEEVLEHSATTPAAIYAMARKYPILFFDNIETRNMNQAFDDFLLIAATGGDKSKREIATNSGIVRERTSCLVLTNGIEPLTKREVISRTLEIGLDIDQYGDPKFQAMKVMAAIRDGRGQALSGLLRVLSKHVVPRIKAGEIQRISKEFGPHCKDRFNEYIALMALILDAIWAYRPCPGFGIPHDLVNEWLASQNLVTQTQNEETNEVVHFLNTFAERRDRLLDAVVTVTKDPSGVVIRGGTSGLLSDFRLLAKHLGIRCPWMNERHLGTRLADAEDLLRKSGWLRVKKTLHGRLVYEYHKREAQGREGVGAIRKVVAGALPPLPQKRRV